MEYNKSNHPYEVINRFWIIEDGEEVEYCNIKFLYTGHTQVVKNDILVTGDFEDISLIKKPAVKPIVKQPVVEVKVKEVTEQPAEDVEDVEAMKIIAISPKGTETEVTDIEQFCKSKKLDLNAVNAVLEGKQKSHKRWGFKRV